VTATVAVTGASVGIGRAVARLSGERGDRVGLIARGQAGPGRRGARRAAGGRHRDGRFAPFAEITPEEFRRVTEVSYLGFVHGTTAALARMRSRDRRVIVQVGSALGERSIPAIGLLRRQARHQRVHLLVAL
jgi:short-subunit dehydrogenase